MQKKAPEATLKNIRPQFFLTVTFLRSTALPLWKASPGEFVEGSEERSGRAASHRSCPARPRPLCRPLRNQLRARVCLHCEAGGQPDGNRRPHLRGVSPGIGEPQTIRVARHSVCRMVVPYRGEPDFGSLAAFRTRSLRRYGTDRF